jgi:hypothetical protein
MRGGPVLVYIRMLSHLYCQHKVGFIKNVLPGQTGITSAQPARSPCHLNAESTDLCCGFFSSESTWATGRMRPKRFRWIRIDGFWQRQLAFPARFWWSRFACLRSKANTSLLVDSGPAFNSVLQVAMPRRWIGRNVRSMSTISITLLSEFYAKTIDDSRKMLRFLLISSISRKWKSCCQGIKRIMNWRISYPPIALPAHIYI